MFNAEELNKKQEQIQQIKREINEACKLAKWKVDCGAGWWSEEIESFKPTGKSVIIPYMHYDCEYYYSYSDSLIDAIMTCFSQHNRPTRINDIEFDKIVVPRPGKYPKYTFDFITKHYETIINHPERAKLEMLLESLDVNNIKLVETMLEGGV